MTPPGIEFLFSFDTLTHWDINNDAFFHNTDKYQLQKGGTK